MPEDSEVDFRHENPYSKKFYENAKYRGESFVSNLKSAGLTDDQINQTLAGIGVHYGLHSAVGADEPGRNWRSDNEEAYTAATDWVTEVTAGAQEHLSRSGQDIMPGNDYRRQSYRPSLKYQPPK